MNNSVNANPARDNFGADVIISSGEAVVNSIVMEVAKEVGISKQELDQLPCQMDPQEVTAMFTNSIKEYFQKLANLRKSRPRGPDGRFISKVQALDDQIQNILGGDPITRYG